MFIDEVKNIQLSAGKGGDGCLSFHRAKFIPKGGPNGGDGGNGGNIILFGNENINDLTAYRFKPHARAQNGQPGMGSCMHGKNGKDRILEVPIGTIIQNAETGEFVCEIIEHNQEIILLNGGKGGKGNTTFKSSTNQAPRYTTPGTPGECGTFNFILKTIADIGLIGFPNAGKSTLTTILTNANPKTGNYPFTTLHVNVGIMNIHENNEKITIADIPGLISGAHENKGLGIKFLKHIERCKALVFLIDMSGIDNRNPINDFITLQNELKYYDKNLLQKPNLIIANKMDQAISVEHLKAFKNKFPVEIIEISCETKAGIENLHKNFIKITTKS